MVLYHYSAKICRDLEFFPSVIEFFLEFWVFFHLEFFSKCPISKPGLVAKLKNKLSFVSSLLGVRVVAGAAVVAVEEVNSSRLNPTLGQLSMSIPSYPQWSSTRNPWSSRDSTMQRKKTWPAKCRHFRRWLPTVRILKSGCSQHCRGGKKVLHWWYPYSESNRGFALMCTGCGLLQLQNLQLLATFRGRTHTETMTKMGAIVCTV